MERRRNHTEVWPSGGGRDRLLDMSEMCELPLTHASDLHALEHVPVAQAAAQRWIEVLGEAASHVSDELKAAHPEIPWRELAAASSGGIEGHGRGDLACDVARRSPVPEHHQVGQREVLPGADPFLEVVVAVPNPVGALVPFASFAQDAT